jgi:hypothetical protein
MNPTNGIIRTVQRKEGIAQAAPQRHTTVRRAAEALSRRNVDQSIVELLNEALNRLTMLCYERDGEGEFCNVDPATRRVLIPLPWGRMGYARWGLTPSEGNVMRRVMLNRQRQGLPLYAYDRSRRAWYFNLHDFADAAGVLSRLGEWEISVAEYKIARSEVLGHGVEGGVGRQ